jgi:type IV pilus assembly protein PilE
MKKINMSSTQNGFNLVELMIVVSIIAILARIAVPVYVKYIGRSNRVAAISYLLNLSNKQTQMMLDTHLYSSTITTTYPVPSQVSSNYTIAVTAPSTTPPTFTITATPVTAQLARDSSCGYLRIDETGNTYISTNGTSYTTGTATVKNCWTGK